MQQWVRALVGLAGPYDFAPFDVAASHDAFGTWLRPASRTRFGDGIVEERIAFHSG